MLQYKAESVRPNPAAASAPELSGRWFSAARLTAPVSAKGSAISVSAVPGAALSVSSAMTERQTASPTPTAANLASSSFAPETRVAASTSSIL